MRTLILLIAFLLSSPFAKAQSLVALRVEIDSFSVARSTLQKDLLGLQNSLREVDNRIDSLKSVLQQAEIDNSGGITLYVKGGGIIRTAKKGTSKIITRVPHEAKLAGLRQDGSYWRVRYDGKEGWISKIFVESSEQHTQRNRAGQRVEKERQERERERQRKEEERQKKQEIADRTRRDAIKKEFSLFLEDHRVSVNSAGGVDVDFRLENIGSKTIKYITFSVVPYNPVGDKLREKFDGRSTFDLRGVGPITKGEKSRYSFDAAFYAGTTSCVELRKIVVEYMNGSSFVYINDLQHIRHPYSGVKLSGECRAW